MKMIFETHAHLDDERYNEDRSEFILGLKAKDIELIVNVGADIQTSKNTIELANKYDFIYGAIGVHAHSAKDLSNDDLNWIKTSASLDKIVAIGEIGLDYYYDMSEREIQRFWFEQQIQLAKEVRLPIIIHSRDAAKDTMDIVKDSKAEEVGGVVHCFSYSYELAKEYVDMGFYIGVGGVITFNNSKKLKEVVEKIPLEFIVLETDCPYLTPVPHRGKRNSPEYISLIAQKVAEIKSIEYDEVVSATNRNARKLYRF
jgi:TatD DNase family protein